MKPGEWFMLYAHEQVPEQITVFEGSFSNRKAVRQITRGQALALYRWHGNRHMWYVVQPTDGMAIAVRVIGDNWAWFGDPSSHWRMTFAQP